MRGQERLKRNSLQVSFQSVNKPPHALRFAYENAGAFGRVNAAECRISAKRAGIFIRESQSIWGFRL